MSANRQSSTPTAETVNVVTADQALQQKLRTLSTIDQEYWSYRPNSAQRRLQRLFQYPAMTVPELQRDLLTAVASVVDVRSAYDPFVGSGTTLTETMRAGLSFYGRDINPLAVLIARVKSGPFPIEQFQQFSNEVVARARLDRDGMGRLAFPKMDRWFEPEVARGLARLRRAIVCIPDMPGRRFLWVALAETARIVSNASPASFKLYWRAASAAKNRSVAATFDQVVGRNLVALTEQRSGLTRAGRIRNDRYTENVSVDWADARAPRVGTRADVLITSPPYGDNKSTVAYGQYSYLALQWIVGEDIDPAWNPDVLRTTQEIDRRSLGGRLPRSSSEIAGARSRSEALDATLTRLDSLPADRAKRVGGFFSDFDAALDPVLERLCAGAYMIWTVGNRTVGGGEVPMDRITRELLGARGCVEVTSFVRAIPIKRLAPRNARSQTMRKETVLVLRKGGKENTDSAQ